MFTLWTENIEFKDRDVQIMTHSGRITQLPHPTTKPFEGATSLEGVRREDDEVLRQLQSTQAHISIWSLLAYSSTHKDALIRTLSQIKVEITTTPKELIHIMMTNKATCIVFSNDDFPLEGSNLTRPLYISVGCSNHKVPYVLLKNGSTLKCLPFSHCYSPWILTFRFWSF